MYSHFITPVFLCAVGIEVEDTGDYLCRTGYDTDETLQDSPIVNIITNPGKPSLSISNNTN